MYSARAREYMQNNWEDHPLTRKAIRDLQHELESEAPKPQEGEDEEKEKERKKNPPR